MMAPRSSFPPGTVLVNPARQTHAGLWSLFAGSTLFLAARLWCKVRRRNSIWWDDCILIFTWLVVLINDIVMSVEMETGFVVKKWDDRMHILINISSCGTLIGQSVSKTAFAVTLLRMTNKWQQHVLWFIIITMNAMALLKTFLQWARHCDDKSYDVWYRPHFCVDSVKLEAFKESGNIYNIAMDFVLALFPWGVAAKLRMRKVEKLGLVFTLSLGMVVAIISAVRTWWVNRPIYEVKDSLYSWRRSVSMIWFSAEINGTIIVQCIPVLRPFLTEVSASLRSKAPGTNQAGTAETAGTAGTAGTAEKLKKCSATTGTYCVTVASVGAEKNDPTSLELRSMDARGRDLEAGRASGAHPRGDRPTEPWRLGSQPRALSPSPSTEPILARQSLGRAESRKSGECPGGGEGRKGPAGDL